MPSAAALALGRVASRWKCPSAALPRSVLEAAGRLAEAVCVCTFE